MVFWVQNQTCNEKKLFTQFVKCRTALMKRGTAGLGEFYIQRKSKNTNFTDPRRKTRTRRSSPSKKTTNLPLSSLFLQMVNAPQVPQAQQQNHTSFPSINQGFSCPTCRLWFGAIEDFLWHILPPGPCQMTDRNGLSPVIFMGTVGGSDEDTE